MGAAGAIDSEIALIGPLVVVGGTVEKRVGSDYDGNERKDGGDKSIIGMPEGVGGLMNSQHW